MAIVAEALKFPLEELAAQAQALLVAAGDTVPHYFGEKHLAANHAPPRYVWVTSGTVTRKEIATQHATTSGLWSRRSSASKCIAGATVSDKRGICDAMRL